MSAVYHWGEVFRSITCYNLLCYTSLLAARGYYVSPVSFLKIEYMTLRSIFVAAVKRPELHRKDLNQYLFAGSAVFVEIYSLAVSSHLGHFLRKCARDLGFASTAFFGLLPPEGD